MSEEDCRQVRCNLVNENKIYFFLRLFDRSLDLLLKCRFSSSWYYYEIPTIFLL